MIDSNKDFTALSVGLSKLLVHALLDLFPKVQLLGECAKDTFFCYQFVSNKPFDQKSLELIENRMIEVKSKGFELYLMEMIPKNAIELFKHHQQKLLQEVLLEMTAPIARIVRFNEYYDLVKSDFESHLQRAHFKLTHFEQEEVEKEYKITLFGIGAENANHLKKKFKEYQLLQKNSHIQQGKDQHLFEKVEKNWLFYPKGVRLLETLKNEVEKEFVKENFQKIDSLGDSFNLKQILENTSFLRGKMKFFLHKKELQYSDNPLNYGLFQINTSTQDQWISIVNKDQIANECISCLKFYQQIIKILGFYYRLRCARSKCSQIQKMVEKLLDSEGLIYEIIEGPSFKLEFDLQDQFGRSFISPAFGIEKIVSKNGEEYFFVSGTFCSSYEKLLAQLLEENQGQMPLKWQPVQLKILSLKEGEEFAQNLYDYFKKNNVEVTIDNSTEKLSARLRQAFIEKVPRIAIIGQKEQEEEKLVVKLPLLNKELKCSKEELLEQVLEELIKRQEN